MAQEKKLVEAITSMSEDFAQWYTDVVVKADLIAYSSVKGCMIIKPDGYAIWENIQHELDRRFKETGVQNVYMPMFIPESLLQVEKDHVEGFAPEVAWVTHGGLNPLQERLCVCSSVWNQCSPPCITVSDAPAFCANSCIVSRSVKLSLEPYKICVGIFHWMGFSRT